MSGAGRKSGYRKNITDEFLNSFPEPGEGEAIVRCTGSRGSNIFEVQLSDEDAERPLALLPNKFKNVIWVKTKSYVIVEGFQEEKEKESATSSGDSKDKVKFQIKNILSKAQIKHLSKTGKWPEGFALTEKSNSEADNEGVRRNRDDNYGGYDDMGMPPMGGEEEEYEEEEKMVMDKMGNFIRKEDLEANLSDGNVFSSTVSAAADKSEVP